MTQVLVSRSVVERNDLTSQNDPVFTVIDCHGTEHLGSSVLFNGPAQLKYDRNKPAGRRIWIETFSEVIVNNGSGSTSIFPHLVEIGEAGE